MQHRPLSPARSDSLKAFSRAGSAHLRFSKTFSRVPRRRTLSIALLVVCIGLVWILFTTLRPGLLKVADTYQRRHRYYHGRLHDKAASPKCCYAEDCIQHDRNRYAVVTTLRNDAYLPLVEELACSLRRTNPGIPLLLFTVPGDLSSEVAGRAGELGKLRYWDDLRFPSNSLDGRFALNWVKLRAWTLEDFDAVLLVDSDVTVVGNITAVFSLPTPFAAVAEQDQGVISYWYSSLGRIQGGVLMLRPCKAVFEHMMSLLHGNRLLQYRNHFAEQVLQEENVET